jgi:hypothetical protein
MYHPLSIVALNTNSISSPTFADPAGVWEVSLAGCMICDVELRHPSISNVDKKMRASIVTFSMLR